MQTRLGFSTEAYFPVTLQGSDQRASLQVLMRNDTDSVLALLPPQYPLVTHREVFEGFEEALLRSGLDGRSVFTHETLPFEGRLAIREYCFNAITVAPGVEEAVAFSLRAVHGYDPLFWHRGSRGDLEITLFGTYWPLLTALLSHDLPVWRYDWDAGCPTEAMMAGIREALEQFRVLGQQWSAWTEVPVTPEAVAHVFAQVYWVGSGAHAHLEALWAQATATRAPTRWLLYTTLMQWVTHGAVRSQPLSERSVAVLAREQCVLAILRSDAFQRLAA